MAKQLTVTLPDDVHNELLALAYAQRLELPEMVERLVRLYGFMRDFCVGELVGSDDGRLTSRRESGQKQRSGNSRAGVEPRG